MAEVLHIPRQPDGQSYYHPSSLKRSAPSSSSLYLNSPSLSSPPLSSSPRSSYTTPVEQHEQIASSPPAASFGSIPPGLPFRISDTYTSDVSLADSTQSLEQRFGSTDNVDFPDYGGVQFFHSNEDFDAESASTDEGSENPGGSTTTDTTRSDSPLPTPTVSDDSALHQPPSRHVDYLSHDWKEEDVWSSWRHIVSQRSVYGQRSRLENASWRQWAKSKYHLRTISPERLNWLKESDVTWLYGPLKQAESNMTTTITTEAKPQLPNSNSFVHKKPILKKRSASEVMLQRSLSATSLIKQAAASVQAQNTAQSRTASRSRTSSDFPRSTASSEPVSRDQLDYFTSRSSSSSEGTPCENCSEKRHIRFDDKVEQCIAVECKDGELDETEPETEHDHGLSDNSDSEDGVVMMKRMNLVTPPPRRKPITPNRSSSHNGRKTIETLPSTTLKYRTESPGAPDTAQTQQRPFGRSWGSGKLSPSPSQETLRPSHPSTNFLLGNEDDGEVDMDSTWSFGASNPKSSLGAGAAASSDLPKLRRDSVYVTKARGAVTTITPEEEDNSMEGMRRTNSGMFVPYDDDEDEDDAMAVGLFGKVSETINTAKDIAHVIWNVGWRK